MTLAFRHQRHNRPAPRRAFWYYGVLLLIAVFAIGWALISPRYYAWALGNERITIVVFCDTADLDTPDLKAVVLYDQIALTPLARALGLYQNRPPESVKVFFPQPVRDYRLTPLAITLKNVRWGPICRLVFITKDKHFHVTVPDRRLFNHTLYVRISP